MIKQGVRNFFTNLKYLFTPLGTIALGFVLGLSVLVPAIGSAITELASEVQTIFAETTLDLSALKDSFTNAVYSLDWSNPIDALLSILNENWVSATLNSCLEALIGSAEAYTVPLGAAVVAFGDKIASGFIALAAFTFLGFVGGFWLTKFLIRFGIARRSIWKFFLVSAVDSLLSATVVALCLWLLALWKPSVFISSTVSIALFCSISLFEAYIVHGRGKVPLGTVVNARNVFALFLSDLIVFALFAVGTAIAVAVNAAVGLFIGIALFEISFIVVSLNAEAYIKSEAEKVSALLPPPSDEPTEPEEPQIKENDAAENSDTTASENAVVKLDGDDSPADCSEAATPETENSAPQENPRDCDGSRTVVEP